MINPPPRKVATNDSAKELTVMATLWGGARGGADIGTKFKTLP